eukprot:c10139_g1_i1.p1 GENE.c10139_g1_i1~~c10139_g1_i1.p1  ORF type:complete len:674 (+),score=218.65 c10139_g1_i1:393-2414(+)
MADEEQSVPCVQTGHMIVHTTHSNNNNNNDNNNNDNTNNLAFQDVDNMPLEKAAEISTEIAQVVNEMKGPGVTKSVQRFGDLAASNTQRVQALSVHMVQRQSEIDQLHTVTLPAIEASIVSRRTRARTVREQIRAMNAKLQKLVDNVDKSAYVQQQQSYMAIIDSLTRIQNAIEMKMMAADMGSGTARVTATHPAALLSIHQSSMPAAKEGSATLLQTQTPELSKEASKEDLDMLHALDLLEIETSAVSSSVVPATTDSTAQRRLSLLLKRINGLLSRLIAKLNDLREKHKEYSRISREMWGKQIDLLQKQSDDLTANLEEVTEQTHFYIMAYNQHVDQMRRLIGEQQRTYSSYLAYQNELRHAGDAFNAEAALRKAQLQKLEEVTFYLSYPNQTYVEDSSAFACNGEKGSVVIDACNVCGGGNSSCLDCLGVPNGKAEMDSCGVCGGHGKSCNYFCGGGANSGVLLDLCGVCGGNNTICVGCDGVPNSGIVLDVCGMCGGDGSTCSANNEPQPVQLAIPAPDETLIIWKLRLTGVSFGPEWVAKHGLEVREAIAKTVNAKLTSAIVDQTNLLKKLLSGGNTGAIDNNANASDGSIAVNTHVNTIPIEKVFIMTAEGTNNVLLTLGVATPTSTSSETSTAISSSVPDLTSSLVNSGIHVTVVDVIISPTATYA